MREIILDSLDGPSVIKWVLTAWIGKWNQRDGNMRGTPLRTVGFEDGRRGEECGARDGSGLQTLEGGKRGSLEKERGPDFSGCCGLNVCVPPPRPSFTRYDPNTRKR